MPLTPKPLTPKSSTPTSKPKPASDDATRVGKAHKDAKPAAKKAPPLRTDIVTGPGGVMTDEEGVITGDLTLETIVEGNRATVNVQYKEAEDWYVVTGGVIELEDAADALAVHTLAVNLLNRPEG